MWLCYLLALIPLVIGAVLWIASKRVVWYEWLAGSAVAFFISLVFNVIAITGMIADQEMRSGWVTSVSHHPQWVEEYRQRHEESWTDSKGKTHTRVWYTTEHDTHPERWAASVTYGSTKNDYDIGKATFTDLKAKFGGAVTDGGRQSSYHGGHRDSGDDKIYATDNKTGYTHPANKFTFFGNRVKAAPSVFSFARPPKDAPIFDYPKDLGWQQSDRLKGDATERVSLYEWDCLNARLGPTKRVNLILVGFKSRDSGLGHQQQAKWVGGKKNDLVLTYGVDESGKVVWTFVFGWTEQEIVKRNLETILLLNPIGNPVLPFIEKEVQANYVIKDWTKFDYITVEPPTWAFVVLLLVMAVVQGGYWLWAMTNCADKD